MRLRTWIACMTAVLGLVSPAMGQGVIGVDGVLSKRSENAVGGGVSVAYNIPSLNGTVGPIGPFGPFAWSLKVMGLGDLEIVTGALNPDVCPVREPTGEFYYYRYCSSGDAIDPSIAEAPGPLRAYVGSYGVVDIGRVRGGIGLAGHPGAGDTVRSAIVGFAASPNSWFMVEFPDLAPKKEWRLRIEIMVAGPPAY